jgi:hypothetical protein
VLLSHTKWVVFRYLHHYEKINHLGQELDSRNDVELEDTPSGRRRFGGPVSLGISFTCNYQQHNMSGKYCVIFMLLYLVLLCEFCSISPLLL